jgi:hypothetical protein
MLTENLNEAKRICMRGELIDTCQTLKYMCAKLLSEMLEQGAHSDEDEDPSMKRKFKRNTIDLFNKEETQDKVKGQGYDLIVDDDLLLNTYNIGKTSTKLHTKEDLTGHDTGNESLNFSVGDDN